MSGGGHKNIASLLVLNENFSVEEGLPLIEQGIVEDKHVVLGFAGDHALPDETVAQLIFQYSLKREPRDGRGAPYYSDRTVRHAARAINAHPQEKRLQILDALRPLDAELAASVLLHLNVPSEA